MSGDLFFHLMEHDFDKGTMLVSSNGKIIKFKPNNNIRWDNFYYNKGKFIKIWSYSFHTNNYGLVQTEDISNQKSILFLGDSFTQGVGAKPWIDKFQGRVLNLQVINGGIKGTGFKEFKALEQYLSSSGFPFNIDIQKIVVLYIGSDIRRNWGFAHNIGGSNYNSAYKSISNYEHLFPLSNQDPYNYLKKIQKNRAVNYKKFTLEKRLKNFIKKQHIWKFARYFIQSIRLENDETIRDSLQAIKDIYTKYGENVYFINMKMPQEIMYQNDSYETKITLEFIKQLTDNTFQCNFENNIDFFHPVEGHPNKNGYENLFNCVKRILLGK